MANGKQTLFSESAVKRRNQISEIKNRGTPETKIYLEYDVK